MELDNVVVSVNGTVACGVVSFNVVVTSLPGAVEMAGVDNVAQETVRISRLVINVST